MFLHVQILVLSCSTLYHLVPPCTIMVQGSTYQCIPVLTDQELPIAVQTSKYPFEISRIAKYPVRYVSAHTCTYSLVQDSR
jgi:hypothetical protein